MNVRSPSTTSNSGRRSRAVIGGAFVATHVRATTAAVAVAVVLTLMATMTVGCHSAAKVRQGGGALPDWPSDPNWQSYVAGPDSDDVTPVAIKRAHGNVTNPDALVNRYGTTTMTVVPGGPPAVIVLDYGQEVGGTPHVDVSDASGSPQVRISTSEALPFLNANTTTTPVHAAAAGATNIKVASIAPFYAGGYATWEVKPQPVDLKWAQGQVPTAYGPLLVKWAQDDQARAGAADGRFHLEVTAPAGTSGKVWVPLSSPDKSVSRALTPGATLLRRDGNHDVYSVGEGTYEFSSVPVDAGSP